MLKLERRARPASYLFFRYSSIALRMSALTGAPDFSERALSLLRCSSPSQMFVRFMYLLVRLSADTCQSVSKLYPIRAAGAFRAAGAPRKISKLRAFNILNGFESHPLRHISRKVADFAAFESVLSLSTPCARLATQTVHTNVLTNVRGGPYSLPVATSYAI